jgi:2,5-diamino-6-(ribosylamino)-4(3H)-pyrimidinone 5'-phosphate reductase
MKNIPVERPFITLNVAMTADGKTDTISRKGVRISSSLDLERVDDLRARYDAVMVGGKTLLGDDPKLTVKSIELRTERVRQGLPENPAKVGIVTDARLTTDCDFLTAGPARVFIFTTTQTNPDQVLRLRECGAQVFIMGDQLVDLEAALPKLKEEGIERLLVEGGGTLNEALLKLNLVDTIRVYIAPFLLGGTKAPTFVSGVGLEREDAINLRLEEVENLGDGGIVVHYAVIAGKTGQSAIEKE